MDILEKLIEFEKGVAIKYLEFTKENLYFGRRGYPNFSRYLEVQIANNLEEFLDIEYCFRENRGVYQLGDFYIGQSQRIRTRFSQHLMECLYDPEKLIEYRIKNFNINKIIKIRETLKNEKLKVRLLDTNVIKEKDYIANSDLNLTNACKTYLKKLREESERNSKILNGV